MESSLELPVNAPALPPPFPAPLPFPKFSFGRVSLVVLAVAGVSDLLVSVPTWLHAPVAIVADVGGFAFAFLLAAGLARLAWGLDPRRRAGGLVFCFVMLLFLLGKVVAPVFGKAIAARRVVQLQELQRQTVAKRERELAHPDALPTGSPGAEQSDAGMLQQRVQLFQDSAREAQGDDRRMLEVDARLMAGFQANVRVYEDAGAALKADGYIASSGLDTREGLAKRKALIKRCSQANAALTVSCQTLEEKFYAEMRRNLPEPRARDAARRAMNGFDAPLMLRIRDCERRMIEGADGVVGLFEREFDRWHLNASKHLVFDNSDAPAVYQQYLQQIRDAANEEEGAQREMVAHAKTRLVH